MLSCYKCSKEIQIDFKFCPYCGSPSGDFEIPFDSIDFTGETVKNELRCPSCGSNQITANKKGFSWKKGLALGILGGFIGSQKIKITCLKCGHQWDAGSA